MTKNIICVAGKIIDLQRAMSEGFAHGQFTIEGLQENRGQTMTIQFQNENLVAHVDGRLVLTVPDLICCLATDGVSSATSLPTARSFSGAAHVQLSSSGVLTSLMQLAIPAGNVSLIHSLSLLSVLALMTAHWVIPPNL